MHNLLIKQIFKLNNHACHTTTFKCWIAFQTSFFQSCKFSPISLSCRSKKLAAGTLVIPKHPAGFKDILRLHPVKNGPKR